MCKCADIRIRYETDFLQSSAEYADVQMRKYPDDLMCRCIGAIKLLDIKCRYVSDNFNLHIHTSAYLHIN